MAAEHTCISEDRLAFLMKEIVQEQIKIKITMNEVKNLKQEISTLKGSLEALLRSVSKEKLKN